MEKSALISFAFLSKVKKRYLYTALLCVAAFLIPLLIALIIFSVNKFLGFGGTTTMLMADAQSEYISYFRTLKNIYLGNDSLIYSMSKAYGGNFLSTYCFYLSSPFNYLLVFIKDEDIPLFMLWISIIKMSLSGLFMYLFLRFHYKKASYFHLIFAISYGLCSYSFIYLSNIMWLDGVMILPLVILGIDHIIEYKKIFLLYPLSLTYALMTSWYIGFMIAVFSVLYFLCNFFNKKLSEYPEKWYKYIIRYGLLSLLGGFIAGCYWFCALLHFSGTKAGGFSFPRPSEFYNFSTVFSGFLTNNYTGSNDILRYGKFVFYFTSTPVLVYLGLYFFSNKYSLKERILDLGMILLYFFSAFWCVLDTLMHGGAIPTWFPFRYGFVVCFIICYLGSKGHEGIDNSNLYGYIVTLLGAFLILLITSLVPTDLGNKYELSVPALIIFIITYLLVLTYYLLKRFNINRAKCIYSISGLAILVLTCFSTFFGENRVVSKTLQSNSYQDYVYYQRDMLYVDDFNAIKDYDQGLYRLENTFSRPGSYNSTDNDPTFYLYNGISHYSSTELRDVMSYNEKIGFHYNYYFEGYDYGSTLAMNSYLGIKYILAKQNHATYFLNHLNRLPIESENGISFYKNQYALPLGFVTNEHDTYFIGEGISIDENRVHWFNHFEYQNVIYQSIVDVKDEHDNPKDIFHPLTVTSYEISTGLTQTLNEDGDYIYKGKAGDQIKVNFIVPAEAYGQNLYFYFKDKNPDLNVTLDYSYYEMMSYWHNGIRSFKDNASHEHVLIITLNKDMDNVRIQQELYYEDLSILNEYIEKIKSQSVTNLTKNISLFSFSLSGDINLTNNQKELLFTLPYEKGMNIYVDNNKIETYKRFNIFTAINLKDISLGNHKIEIRYSDPGFNKGLILTVLGILGLASYQTLTILLLKKKQNKSKENVDLTN